ncbi:hypothetical protein [Bathymodiolus septemdierum thioautotrophic gill symbiont]|uniref:hypothetical protein n=1 Tax=Bathymodiolus septemdierum thioautotrophic gill symbiont TaxID=113267 RepID=UPI0012EEBF9C|nr:hypothetical protein [Bathymodiolus septemdierum thioautotrophic gill symbiont]
MIIRVLITIFVIAYIVWFISNRILGKNLGLAKVIAATLVVVSMIYLTLGILSHLVEGG